MSTSSNEQSICEESPVITRKDRPDSLLKIDPVPKVPKLARYLVLGYRVQATLLCQIAYHHHYKSQIRRDMLSKGLHSDNIKDQLKWTHRGVLDAVSYLKEKSKIPFKLLMQRFVTEDDKYSFVLAFCSNKPLKDDPEFHIDKVRPQDRVDDILEFAHLIYHSNILPYWTAPDDALKLTYYGKKLYDSDDSDSD